MTTPKKTHKTKKTTHNNNASPENTKSTDKPYKWHEDYYDIVTFRTIPLSEAYFDRLAKELVAWVDSHKEVLTIKEFRNIKKILPQVWDEWLKKFPELRAAQEYALSVMGERREKMLIARDASAITFMMPHYDKDWKEAVEWRNNLKKELEATKENKTIVIEQLATGEFKQLSEHKPIINEEV